MKKRLKFESEDLFIPGIIVLFVGLPLAIVLYISGVDYLASAIVGVLVGVFAALAFFSEDYKFLRLVCALIGVSLSVFISYYVQFSMPVTVLVIISGAVLGYFSYKWVGILGYIS